jgi:hypothetical protein
MPLVTEIHGVLHLLRIERPPPGCGEHSVEPPERLDHLSGN